MTELLRPGAVRRLGTQLFHELSTFVYPVNRLRLVRLGGEKTWHYFVSESRPGGCQDVVPDQLFVGHRYLFGL